MTDIPPHTEIRLGEQGRLEIPAALQKSLGFQPGDKLIARLEDGRLVLEKPETIQLRLKARFSKLEKDLSLANELIAERHEEAKRSVDE